MKYALLVSLEEIYVTRPSLPPYEEFEKKLRALWESRIITNNGIYHQEFEDRLCEYLKVPYISVLANGTRFSYSVKSP